MAVLGPWKSRPSLDATKFNVYQQGGKWYATRKEASPAAPTAAQPSPAAATTPTPPPPPPAYDPNYVDAQGLQEISNNKVKYDTARANANTAYANWVAQKYGADSIQRDAAGNVTGYDYTKQGGEMANIARDEQLGVDRQQANAAARGMYRSGNRIVNEGLERTAAADKRTGIENERVGMDFQRLRDINQANIDEGTDRMNSYQGAGARRLNQYRAQWGV